MPTNPQSPCRHPGCRALIPRPGYCPQHQRKTGKAVYDQTRRKQDPMLALAARIRNSAHWQKVRAFHRRLEPLCRDPFTEHGLLPAPNEQSHHIIPISERPDLAFDLNNLAALCTACHARVERIERNGDSTRPLFAAPPREAGQ